MKAERKWSNHDIAKRYREKRKLVQPVAREPSVKIVTPSNAEIETIENRKAKEQRKLARFLKEMVTCGRSTVTIGPELKGRGRATVIAGYGNCLAMRKKKLLLEKLRRLEAQGA